PGNQILDDVGETPPLRLVLGLVMIEFFRPRGRIVDKLREQHGTTGSEWPPRPPQMQGRWVSVPDRFFPSRRLVDGLERNRNLDELLSRFDFNLHEGLSGARSVQAASRRLVLAIYREPQS